MLNIQWCMTITLLLQEERSAYTTKLEELDAELLEKNSQLKIENDKVVKLQEENHKLIQKLKVQIHF